MRSRIFAAVVIRSFGRPLGVAARLAGCRCGHHADQGDDLQHASRRHGDHARDHRRPARHDCRRESRRGRAAGSVFHAARLLRQRPQRPAEHDRVARRFNKTCKQGVEPNCTTYTTESVMILTKLKTVAVTPRLIWAKDDYHVARATLRMAVELADGTQVNVFVAHLPALVGLRHGARDLGQHLQDLGGVVRRSQAGRRRLQRAADREGRPLDEAALHRRLGGRRQRQRVYAREDGTTTLYRRIDYSSPTRRRA